MLGAIIGDVVGSRFEFHNHRDKKFDLFTKNNFFTDDSVCTGAIARSLLEGTETTVKNLQWYGQTFRGRGYGGSFANWLYSANPEPYNSFGNGAAMRVSAVGWIAKDEEEVKKLSKEVTEVTHDHPEGLKGAEVTAMCVFYARQGKNKKFICKYVVSQYPEIKRFRYLWLRKHYYFNETCQNTVPQALFCFLISKSFEDCVRTSVSIGGDTDTLCAISCAVAEAYYGIPEETKTTVLQYFSRLDRALILQPLNEIYKKCGINNYIKL